MNKIDEILEIVKGNAVKKEEKKDCPLVWILAIVGAVVAVAAIARELACFVWGMMTDNISPRLV